MKKKWLPLVLAMVMVCGMFPVSASAANPVTISENGISLTFSDVVSVEEVTIYVPDVVECPPDSLPSPFYYMPDTLENNEKIHIYHLRKDASIVIQNIDTGVHASLSAYYHKGILDASCKLENGRTAPYPVITNANDASSYDQNIYLGGSDIGGFLYEGETSGKVHLNSPSSPGGLVTIGLSRRDLDTWKEAWLNIACAYDDGEYSFTDNAAKKPAQSTTSTSTPVFTDVSADAYYAEPVKWAVEKSITGGTTATTFSPNNTCSTAHILTFLWRANGSPESKAANPFTDIQEGAYYYGAALWAAEKGLVSGASFNANEPCTRAKTMEFMWKAAGSPKASYDGRFADVTADADYAQAVAWAVENGVTGGTTATTFLPDTTCTRGQIVAFLYRAFAK